MGLWKIFACLFLTMISTSKATGSQIPNCIASNTTCVCGQKQDHDKIVGGVEASRGEYPWQVGLIENVRRRGGGHRQLPFCGGSLINGRWVMTAAHCLASYEGRIDVGFSVLLGGHNLEENEADKIVVVPKRIICHPDYNDKTKDYDFGLVELEEEIDFSKHPHVRPICMPTVDPPDDAKVTATGWGLLKGNGQQSSVLMEVDIDLIPSAECKSHYKTLTERMICAGDLNGGKDTCQGDSGGPLIYQQGDNWELQGVTSWGVGCAVPNQPGVYAKVSSAQNWYASYFGPGDGCPRC